MLALRNSFFSKYFNSETRLGCIPYTIWNGFFLVLLLGESLYANSAYGKTWSHWLWCSNTKLLNKSPKFLFTTSIYPSIWGWYVELKDKFVPNFFHRVLKKWPKNLVSWYETIILGKSWSLTTSLKNRFAMWVASLVSWYGMKFSILENLSTTTKIESHPLCILGIPNTKSILTASHGLSGTGNG